MQGQEGLKLEGVGKRDEINSGAITHSGACGRQRHGQTEEEIHADSVP